MTDFVHLHVHTEYSLLDGATRIASIFEKCDRLGMSAVAITDHGNMYGALEFVKAAIRYTDKTADPYEFIAARRPFKVKPILGCELYVTENMDARVSTGGKMPKLNHLILLAELLIEWILRTVHIKGRWQVSFCEPCRIHVPYAEPAIERINETGSGSMCGYCIQFIGNIAAVQGSSVYIFIIVH